MECYSIILKSWMKQMHVVVLVQNVNQELQSITIKILKHKTMYIRLLSINLLLCI